MIDKNKNISYTQLLEQRQKQHKLSKQDFTRVFQQKEQTYPIFDLAQLKGQITSNDIFKRLIQYLKDWNFSIDTKNQIRSERQNQIHKFLYKSMMAITFEQKQIQIINLSRLQKWFSEIMDLKKMKRQIIAEPLKVFKQNKQFKNSYNNFQAFSRLKQYNRRTFELQPKLLYRRQLKSKDKQYLDKKYVNFMNEKKIFEKQLKQFQQYRQIEQINNRVKLISKGKSRYSQNIINKTQFSNYYPSQHVANNKKSQIQEKNNTKQNMKISFFKQQNKKKCDEQKNIFKQYLRESKYHSIRIKTAVTTPMKASKQKQLLQQSNHTKTMSNFRKLYKKVFQGETQNKQKNINLNGVSLISNPFLQNKKQKKNVKHI